MDKELTVLDAYTKRVYKIIMLIIPFSCLSASLTITALHFMGYYDRINETWMWIFNGMDLLFLAIGAHFIATGFDQDGLVKKDKLLWGKYTVAMIAIIQWNAISYIWPFRDFWAYILLFILGEAFFFDVKLVVFTSVGLMLSTFLSWGINGDHLLPARDEFFVANLTFRVVGMFITVMCINVLTFFGGRFLVDELEKYIYRDPLTHLLTRRKMDSYLQNAYGLAQKKGQSFCLAMVDIDNFKRVNDTYGHDCGDEVLKAVASTISLGVTAEDKVFRWGGEEILILFQKGQKDAYQAAETIRQEIEKRQVNYKENVNVAVTVTIGLVAFDGEKDLKAMMDLADERLYDGKQHGKNQVVVGEL